MYCPSGVFVVDVIGKSDYKETARTNEAFDDSFLQKNLQNYVEKRVQYIHFLFVKCCLYEYCANIKAKLESKRMIKRNGCKSIIQRRTSQKKKKM